MDNIQFEWDNNRASINLKKHGITFEEASTVFYDGDAILFDDPDHSEEEERFLILGLSEQTKMLIVSHCYRGKTGRIRIISARKATKKEAKQYVEINQGW